MPEPKTRRSVVVVTGVNDPAGHHVLEGLVDHLVGAGHAAQMCPVEGSNSRTVREADVVMIASPGNEGAVNALIEARRVAGRPTIADVESADTLATTWSPNEPPQLASASARLATSCAGATTASTAMNALLCRLDLRTHLLPSLLTRASAADSRSARATRNRPSAPVVGWSVGGVGTPIPDYAEAVAEAVLALLLERPRLSVETVGEPSDAPARFLAHPRVRALPARPGAEAMSRWTAHLWSPPMLDRCVADNTLPLVEASAVGVPTVLPEPAVTDVGGYPFPGLPVQRFDRADDWLARLRLLLDDEATLSAQSRAALQHFDSTHGPAVADAAVNRFLGWALYRGERT
jgi:hypothetical protein